MAQGSELRAQSTGHRAQGTGHGAQSSGHGAQGSGRKNGFISKSYWLIFHGFSNFNTRILFSALRMNAGVQLFLTMIKAVKVANAVISKELV